MRSILLLALAVVVSGCGGANTLTVNHPTRQIDLDGQRIEDGSVVRVSGTENLTIRIENTNTALYDYRVTAETLASPDAAAVQGFGAAAATYLSEFVAELPGPPAEALAFRPDSVIPEGASSSCARLADPVRNLPALQDELRVLETSALRAIMDLSNAPTSQELADEVQSRFAGAEAPTQSITTALAALAELAGTGCTDFTEEVRQALDTGAKVVQRSSNVDKVVKALAGTRVAWEGTEDSATVDLGAIDFSSGSTLTIQISRATPAPLPLGATLEPVTVKVKALRRYPAYPTFGLSLTYAPNATFPTYSAVETSDSTTVIREGDAKDYRVNYAANLALQLNPFGRVPYLGSVRWVPLQFLVAPTDGVRAVGLATGIRVGAIRIDGGIQWFKRTYLDEQSLGDQLTGEALRTREDYSQPKLFFGVSLVGWEPFVP